MMAKQKKNKSENNFSYQPELFKQSMPDRMPIDLPDVIALNIISHYDINHDQRIRDFCTSFVNFGWNFQATEALKRLSFGQKNYVPYQIYMKCYLYLGSDLLCNPVWTKKVYYSNWARLNEWISFSDIRYWDLPRNVKICIDIVLETIEYKQSTIDHQVRQSNANRESLKTLDFSKIGCKGIDMTIGWISFNLFDSIGSMNSGKTSLNIWPFYNHDPQLGWMKEYNGVSSKIFKNKSKIRRKWHSHLLIQFEEFHKNVVHGMRSFHCIFSQSNKSRPISRETKMWNDLQRSNLVSHKDRALINSISVENITKTDCVNLNKIVKNDEIGYLSKFDKEILFKWRHKYKKIAKWLPLFLKSVDWANPLQVWVAYEMLSEWNHMSSEDAIILLSDKYADKVVRDYAVSILTYLDEDKFHFYTPQLTQALMYEDYHSSSLWDVLLKRGLECPYSIGHAFFWYMKSNLHVLVSYERYSLIIEQFCMLWGRYLNHLNIELQLNNILAGVSSEVVKLK